MRNVEDAKHKSSHGLVTATNALTTGDEHAYVRTTQYHEHLESVDVAR